MNRSSAKQQANLSKFFVIGISYKKADTACRGLFSINNDQYEQILQLAPYWNVNELFILSTCNRTEIYGFAENAALLIDLLCSQTEGSAERFASIAYQRRGIDAVNHLFNVGAGLDSQILGDYEIVGQLKLAVKFAKERGFVGGFMERLFNTVLQSSKAIKNSTKLSSGTVSASFAAIQYIKQYVPSVLDKKIILVGTGKIGINTCKNLVDYLNAKHITLINRTEERAVELARELNLQYAPMNELAVQVIAAEIIIVATNAEQPTVTTKMLEGENHKLVIDLSVPCNVEASASLLPNLKLVNIDSLSKLQDATLHDREADVPIAKDIIGQHIEKFMNWHNRRMHTQDLSAIKELLHDIYIQQLVDAGATEEFDLIAEIQIQGIIKETVHKMNKSNHGGCFYLEAINNFINACA
ncbi:glutamyl-tRNA reductase [Mucilaginibacter sp. Bleaf8]|uniref:glutamyl-tRNA reductase n=1 Tax=Mucilaginibacter sp. Bleaf8 TaxID=2834430 RepID=UPI001BCF4721|nr:glutamyl-tRNA reductase [Mucilaginibacter sp. Bleaf8]MBS7563254.1 glutamyl-tRNA reductase [Mucilaginibacter sp. Bleaf8]